MTNKEAIYRQDVLDLAEKGVLVSNGNYESVCKAINELPSVNLMLCEDAISREDALMCLTGEIKDTDTIETIIARFARRIRKLPPANPTKTGHWIYKQYDGYPECGNWHCSECDEIDNRTSAYCPNCGAKMVEPQERSDKE